MGATEDYSGRTIEGRYRVGRLLGKGGMGTVYLGEHLLIGRQVAIKFLHSEMVEDAEIVKRFYREARTAAAIRHKNIVEILDVGQAPWGDPFLVMEYLDGEDLDEMIERRGVLDLETACGIMERALEALVSAHGKGIIHRDLKPGNIFVVRDPSGVSQIKVIDFGISKFMGSGVETTKLTQTGTLLGTPAYMAPEQALDLGEVDQRADLYSMGVILYECLTGSIPFRGTGYASILAQMLTEEPTNPYVLNPQFPKVAEPVIRRALQKDANNRFQSAGSFLHAIRNISGAKQRRASMRALSANIRPSTMPLPLKNARAGADPREVETRGMTPGGWSRTTGKPHSDGNSSSAFGVALSLVTLVALGLGGYIYYTDFMPRDDDPVVVVEPEKVVEMVQIEIDGIPDDALINYRGLPVDTNPFDARQGTDEVELKIRAEGFEVFRKKIVPSRNLLLEVVLVPAKPVFDTSKLLTELPAGDVPATDLRGSASFIREGKALRVSGDLEGAVDRFKEAIKTNPGSVDAYLEMSDSLRLQEKYLEALAAGRRAVDIGGDAEVIGAALFALGNALKSLGDKEGAIENYEKSLESRPENPQVLESLGKLKRP